MSKPPPSCCSVGEDTRAHLSRCRVQNSIEVWCKSWRAESTWFDDSITDDVRWFSEPFAQVVWISTKHRVSVSQRTFVASPMMLLRYFTFALSTLFLDYFAVTEKKLLNKMSIFCIEIEECMYLIEALQILYKNVYPIIYYPRIVPRCIGIAAVHARNY